MYSTKSFVFIIIPLFIHIYIKEIFCFRVKLRNAYGTAWRDTAVHMVAAVWDAHGWIWHGRFQFNNLSIRLSIRMLLN